MVTQKWARTKSLASHFLLGAVLVEIVPGKQVWIGQPVLVSPTCSKSLHRTDKPEEMQMGLGLQGPISFFPPVFCLLCTNFYWEWHEPAGPAAGFIASRGAVLCPLPGTPTLSFWSSMVRPRRPPLCGRSTSSEPASSFSGRGWVDGGPQQQQPYPPPIAGRPSCPRSAATGWAPASWS